MFRREAVHLRGSTTVEETFTLLEGEAVFRGMKVVRAERRITFRRMLLTSFGKIGDVLKEAGVQWRAGE